MVRKSEYLYSIFDCCLYILSFRTLSVITTIGMGMIIFGPIVVSDCTNSGNISGTTSADNETSITAGLVGWLQGDSNHTGEVTSAITGCSNTGAITGGECHDYGDSFTGGIGAVVTMADILGCTNEASATVTAGNAQDGWVYAGGIVSYFSSHSDANMTAQVHTTISDCANYAAINGAMKGDWVFIGGVAGQLTGGHMVVTRTENYGAIDGRGSADVESIYAGGISGRNVGDCSEIFKCTNYGTVNGGTGNGALITGGISGYHSGVCTNTGDEEFFGRIYDCVNEVSAIITKGVDLSPRNGVDPDIEYGGIAGSVSLYNEAWYPYNPLVCTCCVDKSGCDQLIGSGTDNRGYTEYEHCTHDSH